LLVPVPDELPFDVSGLFGLVLDPLDIGVLSLFFAVSRAMHASRSAAGTLAQTFCASRPRFQGALEMYILPVDLLAPRNPACAISGTGFAFPTYEHVWAAMDGELGAIAVPRAAAISLFHSVFMDFTPCDR
jgi:hypothetical protein